MSQTDELESAPGRTKEQHPPGLYVLFATEMWERFGFYTAASCLTLYLQFGGFGWSEKQATKLWSNYLMFVYLTPLIGGWLADRFLGYRRSILIGGLIFVAGYVMLGLGSVASFYVALALIFAANGFFKPNISTMVGNLYPAGSPLRDSAYNIFYMGINIGALLAPLTAEALLQGFAGAEILEKSKEGLPLSPAEAAALRSGYLSCFYAAAVGMSVGTAVFAVFYRAMSLADRRHAPGDHDAEELAVTEDVAPKAEPAPIDAIPEPRRIAALLVIYAIVIVFWMVFHQNGSTMTYWANKNTAWKVSGVVSAGINAFWIIVLSIPLVKFWGWLNRRGREPSTPTKMALGMLLTGLSFLILYAGARLGGDQTFLTNASGNFLVDKEGVYRVVEHRVSPLWLITAYAVISLGELMLSPMGLSLVSKVAPARMRGMMMGGWFVATAIGNKLTMIGVLWNRWYHSSFWLLCATSALVMTVVLLVLLRPLKRAMPGV